MVAIIGRRYCCYEYNIWLSTSLPVITSILFATFACKILGRIAAGFLQLIQANIHIRMEETIRMRILACFASLFYQFNEFQKIKIFYASTPPKLNICPIKST